jgi:putative holliday junction resolvase
VSNERSGRGRVIAFDPGTVRIGVAVTDSARTMAFPRPHLLGGDDLATRCASVVREEQANVVVIGCPLRMDGTSGEAAAAAATLADAVRAALADPAVDVVLHDERLTTVSASKQLRAAGVDVRSSKNKVDGAAAVVLLESWLAT